MLSVGEMSYFTFRKQNAYKFNRMKSHQLIDKRSLLLARAVVSKIDSDPGHGGLENARKLCQRWVLMHNKPVLHEWTKILGSSWEGIRKMLLDKSENGKRLRQSSPFCGILSPRERWKIYKDFDKNEKT